MELLIIWVVVILIWIVLGLLVGNMLLERLRELSREFLGSRTAPAPAAPAPSPSPSPAPPAGTASP